MSNSNLKINNLDEFKLFLTKLNPTIGQFGG